MIVTILPSGNGGFHAVAYNERKVSEGKAQLIEMKNFGAIGKFGPYTKDELVSYLQTYTSSNDRIKKPQFHIAVSCKGHEMTEQQLLEFAHRYLDEMGYGEDGQPLLVYAHRDTANTHIHIITSRINPHGKKIDHNNERIRSLKLIDKLLGQDAKLKAEQDIENAKAYSVSSQTQFKAVLNSLGYEAYDKNGILNVKKNGMVQKRIPIKKLTPLFKKQVRDWKRNMQLKAILLKYRDISTDKEQLKNEIRTKFGLDLIFFGKKDNPIGYAIIDHNEKKVYHGNSVLQINELLNFSPIEKKLGDVEDFINKLLDADPKATAQEINRKIKRVGMYITQGRLHHASTGTSTLLPENIREQLMRNYKIERIERFHPSTEAERAMLCKMFKLEEHQDSVELTEKDEAYYDFINQVGDLFAEHEGAELRARLRGLGIIIKRDGDEVFALNFKQNLIIDLREEQFNISRLETNTSKTKKQQSSKQRSNTPQLSKSTKRAIDNGNGHSDNREWEVNGRYSDIDDKIDTCLHY